MSSSSRDGRVGSAAGPYCSRRGRESEMNGFRCHPGDVATGGSGGVKVAESISPAIIGSAGARKTPLINTSSRALDNLRPALRTACVRLLPVWRYRTCVVLFTTLVIIR